MAIQEVAAVTATASSISTVPRFNEPIVMVRTESGAPFGPSQDGTRALPESLSRYQVEAQSAYLAMYEALRFSYREKLAKAGHSTADDFRRGNASGDPNAATSSPGGPPPLLAAGPPLMRRQHVDVWA